MLGDTFVPPCFVDKKLSHKGASPRNTGTRRLTKNKELFAPLKNLLMDHHKPCWFLSPNITPLGEMKNEEQICQRQIVQTIANLVGENFHCW